MCISLLLTPGAQPNSWDSWTTTPELQTVWSFQSYRMPKTLWKSSKVPRGHVLSCRLRCRATPLEGQVCPGPVRPGWGLALASAWKIGDRATQAWLPRH